MAFTKVSDISTSIGLGKTYKTSWNKTTAAVAYTAGRWYSSFTLGGQPSAGTYSGTALNAQQCIGSGATPTTGKISCAENVTPNVKHLLAVEAGSATATGAPGLLMLVDMLLYYPGIDMNQSGVQPLVNGVTLPRYTDGVGVQMFLEVLATTGATPHSIHTTDFLYTNGNTPPVANRTVPGACVFTISAIVPHIPYSGVAANNWGPFIPLADTDRGVKSVQQFRLTAASGTASTAALVLCKPLACIPLVTSSIASSRDYVFHMPSFPVIQDGACLMFLWFAGAATVSANFYGTLEFVWG